MRAITGFFAFWYDFIVGDDWTVAAGVVVALGTVAALTHAGVDAFWLLPLAVVAMLTFTVARAVQVAQGR